MFLMYFARASHNSNNHDVLFDLFEPDYAFIILPSSQKSSLTDSSSKPFIEIHIFLDSFHYVKKIEMY